MWELFARKTFRYILWYIILCSFSLLHYDSHNVGSRKPLLLRQYQLTYLIVCQIDLYCSQCKKMQES